ncbi:MAG: flagellin [Gammaproteobacteria bacterium]|nr:flagellin [Gammaproteobacteria bacterium]
MPQTINTNIASLTAQRNLNKSQSSLATSMERLSSGLRINSAKDDAAGLGISDRMTSQIRGLNQAIRNANDGISFAQTGEGALSTSSDAMQRIRELAVQSVNDTNTSQDRQALNNEVQQLIAEVNRIANSTQFNGQNILDGSLSTLTFQVGANQNQTISVDGVDARGSQLGARTGTAGSMTLAASTAATGLIVNGNAVDTSAATTVNDIISAINVVSADSGVTAQKATTVDTGDVTLGAAAATINGVDLGTMSTDAATAVLAINAVTNQTGVTASSSGAGVVNLTNTSGADIVTTGTGLGAANTYQAGIVLAGAVADGAYTATNTTFAVVSGVDLAAAATAATDNTLNGVDVLTGTNATNALLTLDFAMTQVSGFRSELGAVQTRFESTIANLSISSENLSAARSRIMDADFAAETAEMTRSQILQQAGIAMVSQANALPQNVLSLLQ